MSLLVRLKFQLVVNGLSQTSQICLSEKLKLKPKLLRSQMATQLEHIKYFNNTLYICIDIDYIVWYHNLNSIFTPPKASVEAVPTIQAQVWGKPWENIQSQCLFSGIECVGLSSKFFFLWNLRLWMNTYYLGWKWMHSRLTSNIFLSSLRIY